MRTYLDFEKPVAELDAKIEELRALGAAGEGVAIGDEIGRLEGKANLALKDLYANLTPWQKTQVARHPQRPHFSDYVEHLFTEFTPLAGDRKFAEDAAIQGGFARFRGESVCVIGHEKGSSTEARIKHNFGMARPEGYRKAVRLMELADRFDIPVIALVDTAGAYPGIDAEERGQAEAIARSTEACLALRRSQCRGHHRRGRLGRRHCDRDRQCRFDARALDLQRHFSRGRRLDSLARHYQGARSRDQYENHRRRISPRLGWWTSIMPEPTGGAHRHMAATIAATGEAIGGALDGLKGLSREEIKAQRQQKFLAIGRNL